MGVCVHTQGCDASVCLSVTCLPVCFSILSPITGFLLSMAGPLGILVGEEGSATESGEVGLAGGGFRGLGWVLLCGTMLWTPQFPLQI